MTTRPPLNQGQQAAADGFFDFLLSNEKEMVITGPGGVGKSFLMGYLIDVILPQYEKMCGLLQMPVKYREVHMTATTNKAADVLSQATGRPCGTIHSFLNLRVMDDFATGRSKLVKTSSWRIHSNIIVFIDEASTEDATLLAYLRDAMLDCKVVHVGDHCQLTAVGESKPQVFHEGWRTYELLEPMRNSGQPALMDVCAQLRETVETGIFKPIRVVPGVIDLLDDNQMEAELHGEFQKMHSNCRILAYSNPRVLQFNDYVRTDIRRMPPDLVVGEELINNTAIAIGTARISAEESVTVLDVAPAPEMFRLNADVSFEVRRCTLSSGFALIPNVPVPVDRNHITQLIKYYAKQKDWATYFKLKNNFPDLRQREAGTVHKSQGSTYDTVYLDLDNLSTCTQADVGARLLYVAMTRPRFRIAMHGKLTDRFGGIIQ